MLDLNEVRHIMPFLIPIVAIVLGIGLAMLGLWTDHQKKSRLLEIAHEERLRALEHGRDLPELPVAAITGIHPARWKDDPHFLLRRGLTWLLVGLAVGVAVWLNKGPEKATFALIPCAVGLANLIAFALRPKG